MVDRALVAPRVSLSARRHPPRASSALRHCALVRSTVLVFVRGARLGCSKGELSMSAVFYLAIFTLGTGMAIGGYQVARVRRSQKKDERRRRERWQAEQSRS
jgi:hypothetical protein